MRSHPHHHQQGKASDQLEAKAIGAAARGGNDGLMAVQDLQRSLDRSGMAGQDDRPQSTVIEREESTRNRKLAHR